MRDGQLFAEWVSCGSISRDGEVLVRMVPISTGTCSTAVRGWRPVPSRMSLLRHQSEFRPFKAPVRPVLSQFVGVIPFVVAVLQKSLMKVLQRRPVKADPEPGSLRHRE